MKKIKLQASHPAFLPYTDKSNEIMEKISKGEIVTGVNFKLENDVFYIYVDKEIFGMTTYYINGKESIPMPKKIEDFENIIENNNFKASIIGFVENDSQSFYVEVEIIKEAVEEEIEEDNSSIEDEINRIIKEGICSKEELKERIDVMRMNRVNEIIIKDVLASYKKYKKEVRKPKTIYVDPQPNSKEDSIMQTAIINSMIGSPTIFEGIQSTGKNVCAETLAWVLGKPYFLIGIDARSDNDDVFGAKKTEVPEINKISVEEIMKMATAKAKVDMQSKDITNEDIMLAAKFNILQAKASSVSIITEKSEFVEWLETGGILMINEMNMADANFFQSFINPIGDNTGFINTGEGRLMVNPDCWLLGSQNEGFIGSLEQNAATKSRFACIKFPAPNSIKAQLIAEVGKGLEPKYYKACDDLYKFFLRGAYEEKIISSACLNIRGFCRALKVVKKYKNITTLRQQLIIHVVNTCPEEEIEEIKNQVLELINL